MARCLMDDGKPNQIRSDPLGAFLRTSTITGLSSAVNLLMGALRMKVAALVLGPTGVGLIGLLTSAMAVGSTVGDIGVRQAGARAVTITLSSKNDLGRYAVISNSLIFGTSLIGIAFGLTFFLFRHMVADFLDGDAWLASAIGWVSVGVAFAIGTGGPFALLNGHRNVTALGKVGIFTAIGGSAVAIASLWARSDIAIIVFVLSSTIANYVCAIYYVTKLPHWKLTLPKLNDLLIVFGEVFALGKFVMLGGIVIALGEFFTRSWVLKELGSNHLGLFIATATIGTYYLHFLMMATSYDFYPTITKETAAGNDISPVANMQMKFMLMISGFLILGIGALSEFALMTLYSSKFSEASALLSMMVVGDVFKIMCYPLSFILLARSAGAAYLGFKLIEGIGFFGLATVLSSKFGLIGLGFAHIASYATLFTVTVIMLRRTGAFRLDRSVAFVMAALLAAAGGVVWLTRKPLDMVAILAFLLIGSLWVALVAKNLLPWMKQRMAKPSSP